MTVFLGCSCDFFNLSIVSQIFIFYVINYEFLKVRLTFVSQSVKMTFGVLINKIKKGGLFYEF